ncbi:5-(carboxyamino)imidazole ribonucleotide synthase [Saprospiraceae bacterium]|nr:5-(carboxyamino)imidazole ribonucleotide synthase [Saprospiraceae bacterium]
MSKKNLLNTKIGILGGGQLGLMLGQEASNLCLDLHFLDKDTSYPVSAISPNIHKGDFTDYENVMEFGKQMDVISIEIENVNVDALRDLEEKGKKVYPQSRVIRIIKDKGIQKQFYKDNNLPSSPFQLFESKSEIIKAVENGSISYPFVQKSRMFGYDGKGVVVIKSSDDNDEIFDTPSVIEDLVDIDKELAVIVGRNSMGETTLFDTTEMVFNEKGNLLDYLVSPSSVNEDIKKTCKELALKVITELDMIGLLAVELFLTKDGDVLINEVAPRPHNSGHHTIEAYAKSQYRILLDVLLDQELRQNESKNYSAIYNILGDTEHKGSPIYQGLEKVLLLDNIYVHLYNKKQTKPMRKMGHITLIGDSPEILLEKINFIKQNLKVVA